MSPKKNNKKNKALKNIHSLLPKNLGLNKIKINPVNVIEDTKNKIDNFYTNFKKERQKEKIKLEKKRKLDEKKEIEKQKKQAQKERLDKIRDEKK